MMNLQPTSRCFKCGYDLRGISSKVCPECGAPTDSQVVPVHDPLQFHRARAALEHQNLLLGFKEPGGILGAPGVAEGLHHAGYLWVDPNHLDQVEACLDYAGVPSPFSAKPVVDRSEPICPRCESALDSGASETCPKCGTEFQWIDVENDPIDPDGYQCAFCGYELMGNISGACPECNASVIDSVMFGMTPTSPTTVVPSHNSVRHAYRALAGIVLLIPALLMLMAVTTTEWWITDLVWLEVLAIGAGVPGLFLLYQAHRASRTSSNS